MGHTDDLLDGLARDLATAGIGVYHEEEYAPTDTGIGVGELPNACDRAIAIADYLTAGDHPTQALGMIAVQFRFRGLPDDRASMTDLRDSAFQVLQGLTGRDYGACHLIQILRRSSLPGGRDGNRRWEATDNYYADVNPPPTPNRNQ